MRSSKHLQPLTRQPGVAATNLQIKLESTTEIIDRLLLVPRQAMWKAVGEGSFGGTTTTGGTTGGTTGITGDIDEIL
jgi:hypothetical protein